MDVQTLIVAYRKANTSPCREDARHAQWWTEELGEAVAASIPTARLLKSLDRLASHGRSPSTANMYFRFFRRVCAWGVQERILTAPPVSVSPCQNNPSPRCACWLLTRRSLCAQHWGSPMICG